MFRRHTKKKIQHEVPESSKLLEAILHAEQYEGVKDLKGKFTFEVHGSDGLSRIDIIPIPSLTVNQIRKGREYAGQVKFWYGHERGKYAVYYNGKPI